MINKITHIEDIVDDLLHTTIIELLADSFDTKAEFQFAVDVLKQKLEDFDVEDYIAEFDK